MFPRVPRKCRKCSANAAQCAVAVLPSFLSCGLAPLLLLCQRRLGRRDQRTRPYVSDRYVVLSVKYDIHNGLSVFSEYAMEMLESNREYAYSPNRFSKRDCKKYGGPENCKGTHRCTLTYSDGQPDDTTCWKSSYRWHLEAFRRIPGLLVIMLRIIVDSIPGPGQEIEKGIAKELGVGVKVIEVDVKTSPYAVSRRQFEWFVAGMVMSLTSGACAGYCIQLMAVDLHVVDWNLYLNSPLQLLAGLLFAWHPALAHGSSSLATAIKNFSIILILLCVFLSGLIMPSSFTEANGSFVHGFHFPYTASTCLINMATIIGFSSFLTWISQGGLDGWLDREAKFNLQSQLHEARLAPPPGPIRQLRHRWFVHVAISTKALLCMLTAVTLKPRWDNPFRRGVLAAASVLYATHFLNGFDGPVSGSCMDSLCIRLPTTLRLLAYISLFVVARLSLFYFIHWTEDWRHFVMCLWVFATLSGVAFLDATRLKLNDARSNLPHLGISMLCTADSSLQATPSTRPAPMRCCTVVCIMGLMIFIAEFYSVASMVSNR